MTIKNLLDGLRGNVNKKSIGIEQKDMWPRMILLNEITEKELQMNIDYFKISKTRLYVTLNKI